MYEDPFPLKSQDKREKRVLKTLRDKAYKLENETKANLWKKNKKKYKINEY